MGLWGVEVGWEMKRNLDEGMMVTFARLLVLISSRNQ